MRRVAVRLIAFWFLAAAARVGAQTSLIPPPPGHVKVTVEFRQIGQSGEGGVSVQGTGPGGTIVQIDPQGVTGSARVQIQESHRTVRRSVGSFLLIQDEGEGRLRVAEQVPEVFWFQQYALAHNYITRAVMFRQVGTAFVVRPAILPNKRICPKITPQISYRSDEGTGTIEVVEAYTEVVVQSGQPMTIGGSRGSGEAMRQLLLGFERANRTSQVSIVLTGETS
jgi:hypothetical protein